MLSRILLGFLLVAASVKAAISISSLQPSAVTVGSSSFSLAVTGTGFAPGSWVIWNGNNLETKYISAMSLTARVPAQMLIATGTVSVVVSRKDGTHSDPATFSIEPQMTLLTSPQLRPATLGIFYSQAIAIAGGTPPYRFALHRGAVPPGISLNQTTGAVAGIASSEGTYEFTVVVSDAAQSSVSRVFSLTVLRELAILTTSLPRAVVGSPYTYRFQATGGALPHADWQVIDGVLPTGIALERANGTIQGVAARTGIFKFTLRVRDSGGLVATRVLTLEVEPGLFIPTLHPGPPLTVGEPFSQNLAASGGTLPYRWTIASGRLPDGLRIDSITASVIGAPTTAGAYEATIQVTDALGQTASAVFPWNVLPALSLTTDTVLPKGAYGKPYSTTVQAAGGAPPYRFSGSLPAGFTLSATGLIAGEPSFTGSVQFPVTVFDAAGRSVARTFLLEVLAPPPPALDLSGLPITITAASQARVDVRLSSPYPMDLEGAVRIRCDASPPDPAAVFSTGETSARFRIPAGSMTAQFENGPLGFQSGTVAGPLTFEATLGSSGAATHVVRVENSAPVIYSVGLTRTSNGFEVTVIGYSPTRELAEARFRLGGTQNETLATSELIVPIRSLATEWYDSPGSRTFGSQFSYRQGFTVAGSPSAVSSVSVVLTNSVGESVPVTAR